VLLFCVSYPLRLVLVPIDHCEGCGCAVAGLGWLRWGRLGAEHYNKLYAAALWQD
jgi:hypothetical protein